MKIQAITVSRIMLAAATSCAVGIACAGSADLPIQAGGGFSVPAYSIKESRFRSTVRQQYDFSCGSAALSTLLTYHYDYPVTEQVVFQEMFERGDREKIQREGFSLLDIKLYLDAHGFSGDGYEASLEALQTAGVPAIVLLKENGYSHFVVIKGIRNDRVLIGDPSGGTRAMARAKFEALWVNQILFVISNRQELAKFNGDSDWRAAPRAPIGGAISREGLTGILLPKLGAGDF